MPRSSISLFRRIEKALETIAHGSTPLETIQTAANFIAENFADDQTLVVVQRKVSDLEEIPA